MGGGICPTRGVPRRTVRIVFGGRGVGYSLRQEVCVFVSGWGCLRLGMPPAGRAPRRTACGSGTREPPSRKRDDEKARSKLTTV